jgi:hypothetical protein
MQKFSSYQESSTNITNINGKKDIKRSSMDYYKDNNNPGQGEIRLRDNNIQEKISFNDNNMNSVIQHLKTRKKETSSIEDMLNSFLTRKKKKIRKRTEKKKKKKRTEMKEKKRTEKKRTKKKEKKRTEKKKKKRTEKMREKKKKKRKKNHL